MNGKSDLREINSEYHIESRRRFQYNEINSIIEVETMEHYEYKCQGTCSTKILLDIDGDRIENAEILNGCNGNTQGISRLVHGMNVDEVIQTLEGIRCGWKPTSCPDQLAKALKAFKEERKVS